MKKLYFTTLSLIVSSFAFAQSPLITAIVDGDCPGGSPKFVEIYAQGTVDFTKYTLQKQSNDKTEWTNPQDLSALGTLTDSFVYIVKEEDLTIFKQEFPSATTHIISKSSVVDNNGDDRVRLIETETSAVIDQYGQTDTDGTDTNWEYTDAYAKRQSGTKADGTFNPEHWTFGAPKVFDNEGLCQDGTPFETLMQGIATYQTTLSISNKDMARFKMHPNPAQNGWVTFSSIQSGNLNVSIYDVLGKNVLKQTINATPLNVSQLNPGLYLVKVSQNGFNETKKLIIK